VSGGVVGKNPVSIVSINSSNSSSLVHDGRASNSGERRRVGISSSSTHTASSHRIGDKSGRALGLVGERVDLVCPPSGEGDRIGRDTELKVSNGGEISGSARHGINGGSESDGLDNVSTVIPSDEGQSRGVSSQRNSTSRILSHIGSTEGSIAIRVDSRAGVDVDVPEHAAFLHLGGGQRTLSSGSTILHQHRAVIGGRGIGGESQVLSLGESTAEIGAHPVKEGGL